MLIWHVKQQVLAGMEKSVMMIRLDKYLADMGHGTRSEVKKKIRKGFATVNEVVCKESDYKVDLGMDKIKFNTIEVIYQKFEYYMLSKPAGYVSATMDKYDETVIDLIESPRKKELFPVGRLDKDTEGLLLITNDGDLAHRLLSPKNHVDKVYYAKISGVIETCAIDTFLEGIQIGKDDKDETTMPAVLQILKTDKEKQESEIKLTIQEGKFHQVKRMFEAIGHDVLYLKRLSMGSLILDETLAVGTYRVLTDEELKNLC